MFFFFLMWSKLKNKTILSCDECENDNISQHFKSNFQQFENNAGKVKCNKSLKWITMLKLLEL